MTEQLPGGQTGSRWRRLLAGGLILLVGTTTARALDPTRQITQYRLQTWSQERGLLANSVRTTLQAHDGFLSLGTQEGLVRFDGQGTVVRLNVPFRA